MVRRTAVPIGAILLASAAPAPRYDLVIRGGIICAGRCRPA